MAGMHGTNRQTDTGRFFGKFAVKSLLKIPPHLAYVATLVTNRQTDRQTARLTPPIDNIPSSAESKCIFFLFVD